MRKIVAKITLTNQIAIIQSHPESIDYLSNFFTVMDTSECWQRNKFVKELAKPICFITKAQADPTGAMLPIGLVGVLEKILKKLNATYKIIDSRIKQEFNFSDDEIKYCVNEKELRYYQIDALKAMFQNKNGAIKAGTGAGKTTIFTAWTKLTKKKTLILFKEIKLAHQTMDEMILAGVDAGIIQGNNIDENHQVVMCTVQSSHKITRNDYEAIICDEMHNSSQDRYQNILKKNFAYRFGFSATPFNPKNKLKTYKVKAWIGDIIYDKPAKELVDEGYLAKPLIVFYRIKKVVKDVKRGGKLVEQEVEIFDQQWAGAERNGIVLNKYRNKVIKTLANNLSGTVLVLTKYVESHGMKLHEEINEALYLSGKNKLEERKQAVKMLENNEIKVIIASTIFDEGISVNRINSVLLASGGHSYEKTLQRIGRGMRKFVDENGVEKQTVRVFDFYDETHPILEKHAKERIAFMEAEGYEVVIKDLPS